MQELMPLPKYHQVYLVLKERLLQGVYAGKMPGEHALAEEFGVSRVTVRKSLATLVAQGLIERAAGRGTRSLESGTVAPPRLLDNIVSGAGDTHARVLELERVAADETVARELRIQSGSDVLHIARVRSTREGPVSYLRAWVPAGSARGLTRLKLERKPMLSLMEDAGVRIGDAVQTISARQADVAVARLLDVPVGSALLAVKRVVFDVDGEPVQLLQGQYRPDRYEYEMKLSRSDTGDTARLWVGSSISQPTPLASAGKRGRTRKGGAD